MYEPSEIAAFSFSTLASSMPDAFLAASVAFAKVLAESVKTTSSDWTATFFWATALLAVLVATFLAVATDSFMPL